MKVLNDEKAAAGMASRSARVLILGRSARGGFFIFVENSQIKEPWCWCIIFFETITGASPHNLHSLLDERRCVDPTTVNDWVRSQIWSMNGKFTAAVCG